jgi:CheY-like chemotaxis protein
MSRPLRILLVEDDHEDARLFQRRCPAHFQVEHASSPESALTLLGSARWDLCFVDYRLGVDTGLELVRTLRARGLRLPLVLITGQDIDTLGDNALLTGATEFLSKDAISARELDRVARWALIRRHVETRQASEEDRAVIEDLLGPAPRAHRAASPLVLRRVLYLSRARRVLRTRELLSMCGRFSAANARVHITGALLAVGDRYLQVIEGETTAIEMLLRRIAQDPRHGDMAILFDERSRQRLFADWNMGCIRLDERYELTPSQWQAAHGRVLRLLETAGSRREGLEQLMQALPTLLARAEVAES